MQMNKGLALMLLCLAVPSFAHAGQLCVTKKPDIIGTNADSRSSIQTETAPMFVDGFDSPVKPQNVITQFRCGENVTIWAYDVDHGYFLVGGSIQHSYSRGVTAFVSATYMQMNEREEDVVERLSSAKREFILANPCPSTGKSSSKKCPGYWLGFHLTSRKLQWNSVEEDRKKMEEIKKEIQSQK